MFHFNFCTGSSITKALNSIKLWGKFMSVVRGKSKIKYQKHLNWLQIICIRRCGDYHKEMQLITYYAKCGWDTRTWRPSFMLMQKIKCRETGISAFFFLIRETSSGENCLGTLFSPIESRVFQVNICHAVIQCSSICVSLSNIL